MQTNSKLIKLRNDYNSIDTAKDLKSRKLSNSDYNAIPYLINSLLRCGYALPCKEAVANFFKTFNFTVCTVNEFLL